MRQYFVQPTDAVAVAVAVVSVSVPSIRCLLSSNPPLHRPSFSDAIAHVRSLVYGPVVYTIVALLLFDFTNEH